MPADPFHPDRLDGEARFRADLVAYLGSLPLGELAELLGKLPRSRQQPLGLGVLMIALNERLPDGYKLLPPVGHPGPGEGRRHSLRQVVADRRAARASQHPDGPASGLAESLADRQHQADLHADRAQAGTVGERRVAEALRARAAESDPAARPATHWPSGSATGKTRSVTASLRTTSAITGTLTVSAPTTSAEPTAGGCRSRRRGPSLGCHWAATTTRSATATVRTANLGCSTPQPSPGPVAGAGALRWRCWGWSLRAGPGDGLCGGQSRMKRLALAMVVLVRFGRQRCRHRPGSD